LGIKVENFLGQELALPEDFLYDPGEGLWARELEDGRMAFGITEPALLMAGAVRQVEILVEDGSEVEAGDTVLLALTSRLKYVATPVSGTVHFPDMADLAARLAEATYDTTLFLIKVGRHGTHGLLDANDYAESLRATEGARNPGGAKGGVSPTCKAVYMGLGEQKLPDHD